MKHCDSCVRPRVKLRIVPFMAPEGRSSHPEGAVFLLLDGNHARSAELHVHPRYLRQLAVSTLNDIANTEWTGRAHRCVVGISGTGVSCPRLDHPNPQLLQILH